VARCSYHPDVETEMRCAECGKPICPREMVLTPVGYKCPEDARPARSQYVLIKPRQVALASAAGLGMAALSGLILAFIGWGGLLLGLLWGASTSEVVRRASGGHRGGTVAAIAVASLGLGWVIGNMFGRISLFTTLVAVVVALVQLAVIQLRR
jgi:hypothetical protein